MMRPSFRNRYVLPADDALLVDDGMVAEPCLGLGVHAKGGGGDDGVKYQQYRDNEREQKVKAAVDEIYKVFGYTADGREIKQRPQSVAPNGAFDYSQLFQNGGSFPFGFNFLGGGNYAANTVARNQQAYDNKVRWDNEFSEVYDSVMDHHKRSLNKSRDDITDATMAQMLRQGMGGSHLSNQYNHQINDKYLQGLGQVDAIATSAKEKAKGNVNSLMNNAIAQVHADNFEAANAATLNQQVANSIDTAQATANSQNLGNLFTDLADAYERRRINKGTTLANQSYYSTSGNNGTVTGG